MHCYLPSKKELLVYCEMIAEGKTLTEIADTIGMHRHTLYCRFLDIRKTGLFVYKDPEHYFINTQYFIKKEEV